MTPATTAIRITTPITSGRPGTVFHAISTGRLRSWSSIR